MDLLTQFKEHLFSQKNAPSQITIKNYIADIRKFLSWYSAAYKKPFNPSEVTYQIVENFKEAYTPKLAATSLERHISALRKFFTFLASQGIISVSPFEEFKKLQLEPIDLWHLQEFKNYLYGSKASHLTIKNYVIDLKQFFSWLIKVSPDTLGISNISNAQVDEYKNRLYKEKIFSPLSINRKLSSLRKYMNWAVEQGFTERRATTTNLLINNEPIAETDTHFLQTFHEIEKKTEKPLQGYSPIPPLRLFQKLQHVQSLLFDTMVILPIAKLVLFSSGMVEALQGNRVFRQGKKSETKNTTRILAPERIKNISKSLYSPLSLSTENFSRSKKVFHLLRHARPNWYKRYRSNATSYYFNIVILIVFSGALTFGLYTKFIVDPKVNGHTLAALPSALPRILSFKGRLTDKSNNPLINRTDLRFAIYNDATASGSALLWQENLSVSPDTDGTFSTQLGKNTQIPPSLFSQSASLYLGISVGQTGELSPRQQLATVATAANAETLQGLKPITAGGAGTNNVLLALDSSGNLTIGGSANPTFQASGGQFQLLGDSLILGTNNGTNGNITLAPDGAGLIDLRKPLQNSTINNNLRSAAGAVEIDDLLAVLATSSGQSAFTLNQDGTGPLISASTSGVSKFTVANDGTTYVAGNLGVGVTTPSSFALQVAGNVGPNTTDAYNLGSPSKEWDNLYVKNIITSSTSGQNGFWQVNSGVLSPATLTNQLAIGQPTALANAALDAEVNSKGNATAVINNTGGSGDIFTASSSGVTRFVIDKNGNTGIGTNLPGRTLDVNGNWGGNEDDNIQSDAGTTTITDTTKALVYNLNAKKTISDSQAVTTFNLTGLPNTSGTFAYIAVKASHNTNVGMNAQQCINVSVNGSPAVLASPLCDTPGNNQSEINKQFILVNVNNQWTAYNSPNNTAPQSTFPFTADLGEWIKANGRQPQKGELLSIGDHTTVHLPLAAYDSKVAGIVSTNPHTVYGQQASDAVPLALAGRIPVVVTSLSGNMQAGEAIVSSPLPGVGMIPQQASQSVGKALESFTPSAATCQTASSYDTIPWPDDDGTNPNHPCFAIPVSSFDKVIQQDLRANYNLQPADSIYIGKIMALANLSFTTPVIEVAASGDLNIASYLKPDGSTGYQLQDPNGNMVTKIGTFSHAVIASLAVGFIKTQEAVITNFTATAASITDLTTNKIVSPIADIDQLHVNILSPLSPDSKIAVDLNNSTLTIHSSDSASSSAVATIDNKGNASLAGNLQVAKDATVSGTLRAGKIYANDIVGLPTATESATYINNVTNIYQSTNSAIASAPIATASESSLSAQPTTSAMNNQQQSANYADIASYSAYLSYVPHLDSATFGATGPNPNNQAPTTFADVGVGGTLSVGSRLVLADNTINVLGADLQLQPLKQGGVSIAGGQVYIDNNGNLTVSGDATFNGSLAANIISPITGHDLILSLDNKDATRSPHPILPNLAVKNASGSGVFAINQLGDIIASGAATVSKLNLTIAQPALAVSDTEQIASGSAGSAAIASYRKELTIDNPLVTERSLIYITPVGNPADQAPYLLRQVANKSFTVGISIFSRTPTLFNWLIIN